MNKAQRRFLLGLPTSGKAGLRGAQTGRALCVGLTLLMAVACADRTASVIVPARFILKTSRPTETAVLGRQLEELLGAGVSVERLFDEVDPGEDPDGMARMFHATIPRQSLPSEHLWDTAYTLEEQLDLEEVEPDLNSTLEQGLETTRLCVVDDPPPEDKAWSLAEIHAVEAWGLTPPAGGRRFGEGIFICHPDTGWAEHVELDASSLDLDRSRNLLGTGPANGRDPLNYEGPMRNPGHGTGTASVIVSDHEYGEVLGVAPSATLVPIRTAMSVVQVFDSDLARSVNYSVDAGCDVISISLGGRAFFGLRAAIRRAVRHNLIVAAAAGNCVGFVVAPAAYDETLAIAATNIRSEGWKGSSRGRAIDVSAPGEHVWAAKRRRADAPTVEITPGQGTSYAVANVAGAAVLWLAFHGRDALISRYGPDARLQEVFRALLKRTSRVPDRWDANQFGAGVLDVEALLRAELQPLGEESDALLTESRESELSLFAAVLDRSPQELGLLVASLFHSSTEKVEDHLKNWGPELIQMALADPPGFERMLQLLAGEERGTIDGSASEDLLPTASASLRRQLR